MKPEIKAMLPNLPLLVSACDVHPLSKMYFASAIEAWLEKITEGAQVMYGGVGVAGNLWNIEQVSDDTHTALLICPREIDTAVPLSEVIKELKMMGSLDKVAHVLADRLEKFGVK